MSWKLRVLVSAMLLAPSAAMALGLGEIRLKSALNEPLSAEIDLVAATAEELAALEATLATPEVFQRYGLDRPAFLDSLEFQVGRGQDGRNMLLVRSSDSISEPFVSFLVDVNWSRGRLLREYTVLLDPPVLAPPGASPAPVALSPPLTAPAPARPAPAAEAAPTAVAQGADSYQVQRGDTLYEIAGSLSGGDRQATRQMMIGLYRANPDAFANNINVLRAGAILRVPAADEVASVSTGDAAAEISRQNAEWRARGGGGRLRLVAPEEGAGGATASRSEPSGDVQSQINSLEQDINEQRRLLDLKNQELAKLQQDLARSRAAEDAAAQQAAADKAAADKAAADKAAADAAAAQTTAPAVPGETAVAPEDDVKAATPRKPVRKPAAKPAAAASSGPSILEQLTSNWLILAGAAAFLLAGGLAFGYFRRRRDEDAAGALRSFDLPATAPVPSETMRLRALEGTEVREFPAAEDETAEFLVEERPIARPKAEAARPAAAVHEETISAEAAIDLDQADPLAEADFHMAYGLYDQAVDLVRMALQNQPDRNDLKLKLAEIHFVAGDTSQFLNVARDLKKSLGPGGDWDRIVIMGRQLAPDEPMFAGGVQDAGVDLSLEGGDNRVDLDLLSAPEGDEGLDLDLGKVAATADSAAETGESTAIEFNLDGDVPAGGTTTQELQKRTGTHTVEMPTLELPTSETPTVETPAVRARGDTSRQRTMTDTGTGAADATAEMAIDDLGLDVSGLDSLQDADDATAITTGISEDSTQVAAFVERTQRIERPVDDDGTAVLPAIESGGTGVMKQLETGGVDFDLGAGGAGDDRDYAPTVREDRLATEQMPQLSELEPVTMSEVGTKLDLARAYMDMGDPDGARNILQEVLAEGSASQKQEARRLIDSLPGA